MNKKYDKELEDLRTELGLKAMCLIDDIDNALKYITDVKEQLLSKWNMELGWKEEDGDDFPEEVDLTIKNFDLWFDFSPAETNYLCHPDYLEYTNGENHGKGDITLTYDELLKLDEKEFFLSILPKTHLIKGSKKSVRFYKTSAMDYLELIKK